MKKAILVLAVLGAGYYAYTKYGKSEKLDPTDENAEIPNDIFTLYNNRIIKDKDGYWMLVKDGHLYSPVSIDTVQAWQKANPQNAEIINVQESIWLTYSSDKAAGSF